MPESGSGVGASSHGSRSWRRGRLLLLGLLGVGLAVWGCEGDTLYDPTGVEDPGGPTDPGEEPEPGEPTGAVAVLVEVDAPDRIELTDEIRVRVQGWAPEARVAISELGFTAVVRDPETGAELERGGAATVDAEPADTVATSFTLRPEWLTDPDLPATFELQVYGWALNRNNVCAAAVPEDRTQVFACDVLEIGGTEVIVGEASAAPIPVTAVPGRTTPFSSSPMLVGDLQVDTIRERAYLSNRLSNHLHVLDPVGFEWAPNVNVGAEPWGLHLNRTGDTLLVANSGGTNVSRVRLEGTPAEVVSQRIQVRNTALFEIDIGEEDLAEAVRFFDFSDRPQYIAEDSEGRILYSTRPTGAAPTGTVRIVTNQGGWEEHETRILARIPKDVLVNNDTSTVTVLNADSIIPYVNGMIEVWDHRPGFPSQIIRSGIQPPLDALDAMAGDPQSDVEFLVGSTWDLEAVSFADTTYVATSRDRGYVAFGDGGEPDIGRVVLWHAPTATISRRLTVADLVHNASERVRALELNRDGSLGIARGAFGTYFFSNDLRLRGTVPEAVDGGGGAALHPDHPDTPAPSASSATTVAFTMSGDRTIRILDTVHYNERGRILVRDPINGPLRVTPPLPSDNNGQGRNCSGSDCVVAKVFAVTDGGGVLVLDVRASDIQGAQ